MESVSWSRALWRKSSRSNTNGNCVEIVRVGDVVAIRDSADPDGAVLTVPFTDFQAFAAALRRSVGPFDSGRRVLSEQPTP